MKKIIGAALILIGSSVLGYAADPGASRYSPGDKMHDLGKGDRSAGLKRAQRQLHVIESDLRARGVFK